MFLLHPFSETADLHKIPHGIIITTTVIIMMIMIIIIIIMLYVLPNI